MNPSEINQAIAEALGIKPKRMWRVWYDAERQHGSICIPTFKEAIERKAKELESAQRLNYQVEVSEPEEYDEWEDAPDYHGDLNAIAQAERTLREPEKRRYIERLAHSMPSTKYTVCATAPQRCEAFLKCKGLWKPHPEPQDAP